MMYESGSKTVCECACVCARKHYRYGICTHVSGTMYTYKYTAEAREDIWSPALPFHSSSLR